MFEKVLVANRGEIAVRVMRTLHEMGIKSVAVFSEPDREALHVRMANEAYCIGPAQSTESYLRIDKILEVAKKSGAQAIHPGYGFLSENAEFSEACKAAGVVFIGPSAYSIESMGSKTRAREIMAKADVPLVPGSEAIEDAFEALEFAKKAGFPVLVKASAGGGGKGMRRVDREEDFIDAFAGARREALAAFGNGDVFIEKYVVNPKHVEFQVLADTHGNTIHIFERECSVQRRHQKIIEEAPCPVLRPEVREKMGQVAIKAVESVDYVGAGTVEFLIDVDQNFYFLEVNTRLQVEHPITEMISGLDLVRWQVRIANGEELTIKQEDLERRGHAIECRIYAEDPDNNFMPSPGHIPFMKEPTGPNVRVDSGVYSGSTVPVYYDPMISKLSVWGANRQEAIERMRRALKEYVVIGIRSNLAFHDEVLQHPEFLDGSYDTEFVPNLLKNREVQPPKFELAAQIAAVIQAHRQDEALTQKTSTAAQPTSSSDNWTVLGRLEQQRRY